MLVLVGLAAGIVSGMFGVGGGIVVVPALVLATGLGFRDAVAASLLFMVFTAPLGAYRYWRNDRLDVRTGLVLAASGAAGVLAAALVGPWLTDRTLLLGFAAVLVLASRNLVYGRLPERHVRSTGLILAVGVGSGFVAKLFGIGGGIVIVPALVFTGFGVHAAIGTSLFVVSANGLLSSLVNLLRPGAWALWAIPIAVGALAGVQVGARQALRTHGAVLRGWFGLLMVLVALQLARRAL